MTSSSMLPAVLASAAVLALAGATRERAAWIDPAWQDAGTPPSGQQHYATIWFDRQYVDAAHSYASRTEQYRDAMRSAVRRAVIDTLKQLHEASWNEAQSTFAELERAGRLTRCERHWIVNSVTCAVPDNNVTGLVAIPGAARIYFAGAAGRAPAAATPLTFIPPAEDAAQEYVPAPRRATNGQRLLGVDRVWSELGLTGRGVLHVIHDMGWVLTQPGIRATLWRNPREVAGNGADDDGNGYIDDVHGFHFDRNTADIGAAGGPLPGGSTHGDLTAAVAAGRELADTALITGVAPNSRWAGIVNNFAIERSLEWAVELNAHTYSMSFSIPNLAEYRSHWRRAAEHAALAGLFLVSGAGNFADSTRPNYAPVPVQMRVPEDIPLAVFGVSGVGEDGQRPVFASQGPVEWRTDEHRDGLVNKPDFATINANIIGFDSIGRRFVPTARGWMGNSFAGPHLAGVLALMLEADPELTPWRARDILARTARDIGAPGFDPQSGAGLVDAYAAAVAAKAGASR